MVGPTSHEGIQKMFLEYEVSSSFFASLVWWQWGQDLCARYFAWKVRKKYARYLESIRIRRELRAKQL
jgi:hypothetical protein